MGTLVVADEDSRFLNAAIRPRTMSIILYSIFAVLSICFVLFAVGVECILSVRRYQLSPIRDTVVPVSCEPQHENDGHLIHVDCPLRRTRVFHPPPEFSANLEPYSGVFFEMKVEMYQWEVTTGTFGLSLEGVWKDGLVASPHTSFLRPLFKEYNNPDFMPHIPGSGRHFAKNLFAGGFRLDRPHLIEFRTKQQLPLIDDKVYKPVAERPPTIVSSTSTQVRGNALYSGNPNKPLVGDVRITFWASPATHVSAIGVQSWKSSSSYPSIIGFRDPRSHKNQTLSIVKEGDFTPDELYWDFVKGQEASTHTRVAFAVTNFCLFLLLFGFGVKVTDSHKVHSALSITANTFLLSTGLLALVYGSLRSIYDMTGGITTAVIGLMLIVGSSIFLSQSSKKYSTYTSLPNTSTLPLQNSSSVFSPFQGSAAKTPALATTPAYRQLSSDPLNDQPSSSRLEIEGRSRGVASDEADMVSRVSPGSDSRNLHTYTPV